MKYGRFPRITCVAIVALLMFCQVSSAQSFTVKSSDLLRFEIKVVPEDPFDPANAQKNGDPLKVRRGQIVKIVFEGTPKLGYHTYSLTKRTVKQDNFISSWELGAAPGVTPLWPISETEPETHVEKGLGISLLEHTKAFAWSQDVLVRSDAEPGLLKIPLNIDMQVCNDKGCTPLNQYTHVSFEVTKETPLPMTDNLKARLSVAKPEIEVVGGDVAKKTPEQKALALAVAQGKSTVMNDGLIKGSHEEYKAKMDAIAKQIVARGGAAAAANADLLAFILSGIFWGAISLITPCVFPMIPITVSFFLKQSEKEHHRPLLMASVYSLTIVIVLTLAATLLLSIFRMMSIHPVTNYFIGGLFVFFALSLFGMYDIELPSSLAQFTSSREGKGGMAGTIFMALTFTIISFACVAPFLGGFSGTSAAARPWWHNLLGGLAFSATFASPFFFLALFPVLLRKLPKSGSWLNSVKVVMGFLELAAAFKFFRTAELIQSAGVPSFFTFDLVLGLWVAMSVLCGLYLLGIFRLPHDTPEERITVPRLLFSAVFLGLALYLAPALFKVNANGQSQRPGGSIYAWVDSFLLPESVEGDAEVVHTANLDFAVAHARAETKRTRVPKRIFIDFTGVTCTNCKINEKSVFSKIQVNKLFEPYLFVKLYTDTVPLEYYAPDVRAELARNRSRSKQDAAKVNLPFQLKVFNTEQLPLYVVLEPKLDGGIAIVGVYDEARINNEDAFADFLRNPDGF